MGERKLWKSEQNGFFVYFLKEILLFLTEDEYFPFCVWIFWYAKQWRQRWKCWMSGSKPPPHFKENKNPGQISRYQAQKNTEPTWRILYKKRLHKTLCFLFVVFSKNADSLLLKSKDNRSRRARICTKVENRKAKGESEPVRETSPFGFGFLGSSGFSFSLCFLLFYNAF